MKIIRVNLILQELSKVMENDVFLRFYRSVHET